MLLDLGAVFLSEPCEHWFEGFLGAVVRVRVRIASCGETNMVLGFCHDAHFASALSSVSVFSYRGPMSATDIQLLDVASA